MTDATAFLPSQAVPIGRLSKSLPEQVAAELTAAIAEGKLEPGARLKEESLAERFAVSRSTVREAIAILERRGIAERVPRIGARVTVIHAAEIEEIFSIRAQLLGLAARVAAERGDDGLKGRLLAQLKTLRELAKNPQTTSAAYAAASIEMQRLLVSANGHKRLAAMYDDLSSLGVWQHAVREKSISFRTPERRRQSATDWARVIEAVVARDGQTAECQARVLLMSSYHAVIAQWGHT